MPLTKTRFVELCRTFHIEPMIVDSLWLKVKEELEPKADNYQPTQKVIGAYCRAYKESFKTTENPHIDGQATKALKAIVESRGEQKTTALVEFYLTMKDSFFMQRGYSLLTFCQNFDKISLAYETGKSMNSTQAKIEERKATNRDVVRTYLNKDPK